MAVRKAVPQPRSEEGDVQAEGQAGWEQQPPPEDRNSVVVMQSEPGSEELCPAAEMAQDPGDSDAPPRKAPSRTRSSCVSSS